MSDNLQKSSSFWEKTDFDIISESQSETEFTAVIRNRFSGAEITCHIPKHTAEEQRKIADELTRALVQIGLTGQDLSKCARMEVQGE